MLLKGELTKNVQSIRHLKWLTKDHEVLLLHFFQIKTVNQTTFQNVSKHFL